MAQKAFGILKKSKCIGAAATLTVVSALLIFAVIGGAARPGGAVPASAGAEESVVYALSYTDTASENGGPFFRRLSIIARILSCPSFPLSV